MFSDPKKNLEQFDIAPGMRVADFGAGIGFYTFICARSVGPTGVVYALDIQKDLLVTLKRESEKSHLFNIEIIWSDFESDQVGKLKEKIVERGIVANVLFQVKNKDRFAREIARVVRPGGKILVIDWTDSFGGIGPEKSEVFLKGECKKLFERNGFELEKNILAGMHHYGFVFKKVL